MGDLTETSGPFRMYLCVVGHCSGSGANREYFSRGIVSTAVIFQPRQIDWDKYKDDSELRPLVLGHNGCLESNFGGGRYRDQGSVAEREK